MTDPDKHPPELPDVRRRKPRRLLLGAATALVVAAGGGAAITAAANNASNEGTTQAQPAPAWHHRQQVPAGPQQGGYQTFTSQTGTVSAVQEGSISVTGGDGAARTYTVDDNTRVAAGSRGLTGIRTGDSVWVVGTTGSSPRALVVVDASRPPLPGMGGAGAPGGETPTAPPTSPPETTPAPETTPTEPGETVSPETVPPTG